MANGEWRCGVGDRACRVCGCTEYEPCEPPCGWADEELCTACEGRPAELYDALAGCVLAMALWGSWEDGVPLGATDTGEVGEVGKAFERACELLGVRRDNVFQELRRE